MSERRFILSRTDIVSVDRVSTVPPQDYWKTWDKMWSHVCQWEEWAYWWGKGQTAKVIISVEVTR